MNSQKSPKAKSSAASALDRVKATGLSKTQSKNYAAAKAAAANQVSVIDAIAGQMQAAASRRDFNLIRAILLQAEQTGPHTFDIPGYERAMVESHLLLLIEVGLVQGSIMRDGTGPATHVLVDRLTWSGHDLVALLRDNARWEETRTAVLDAHGRAHFDVLVAWLKRPPQ
jgi:hypothetical protein